MPTTPTYGLRYPANTDAPNVPLDIGNLATDIEAKIAPGTATGQVPVWDNTAKTWTGGALPANSVGGSQITDGTVGTNELAASAVTQAKVSFPVNLYTPTWTADTTNPVLGNGTLAGRFAQIGKFIHLQIVLTIGSTTTLGSGTWYFSFPVTSEGSLFVGGGKAVDTSAGIASPIFPEPSTTSLFRMLYVVQATAAYGVVTHAAPIPWASGDQIFVNLPYLST